MRPYRGRVHGEFVRGAVEAVAANSVLRGEGFGDGVRVTLGRDGLMEGRVEDRHVRRLGHQLLRRLDAGDVCRIVQWSEVRRRLDSGQGLIRLCVIPKSARVFGHPQIREVHIVKGLTLSSMMTGLDS